MARSNHSFRPTTGDSPASRLVFSRRRALAAALGAVAAAEIGADLLRVHGPSAKADEPLPDVVLAGFDTTRWDQAWLVADTLRFEPGAILRFSHEAVIAGDGTIVIMARTLEGDQATPGSITWDAAASPPPAKPAKAAPGTTGTNNQGTNGAPGAPGANAGNEVVLPSLQLWVLNVPAELTLNMVLPGQDGQPGSEGGDGGNGGPGRFGKNGGYDDEPPECNPGSNCPPHLCWHPGPGYPGGDGGQGGGGGKGGNGGDGGNLTIFAPEELLPALRGYVTFEAPGGAPGRGGGGGQGGAAGPGGRGGTVGDFERTDWLQHCGTQAGLVAADGPSGQQGPAGPANSLQGEPGSSADAEPTLVPIIEPTFDAILATAPSG